MARLRIKQFLEIALNNLQNGQYLAWDPTANGGDGAFVNTDQPSDGSAGDKGSQGPGGEIGAKGAKGATASDGEPGAKGCLLYTF